ncbi:MAG: cryptochrome/photolyase family protein [Halorientalis sp.]
MTVLVLGDQLTRTVGPLADHDGRVLLIEAREFARRHPYHPHKLALVFAAMRRFRDRLRADGFTVDYRQCETFADGLDAHFAEYPDDDLTVVRPSSHGGADRLRELVADAGGSLTVVEDERFLCSRAAFDAWASDRDGLTHESFYRYMRRETGYLMDGDEPIGGEWNYDEQNRETPPAGYEPPEPPTFAYDDVTRETVEWVESAFAGGYDEPPYGGDWADPGPFRWPVTREQALCALDRFAESRLPEFGPYQDAMLESEWAMNHSLLSAPLNLGLLTPEEVVERVLDAYRERDLPLNSVEGFVRQVIGWREFVRHVYRREMPALATANQLGQTEPLPEFYWTGETDMACLSDVIDGVRERGYSHHIERLMILSNFALLYGVDPAELNRWFQAGYVDASHWVTTPNVVEMGSFGAGVFATKPYAASANYVDEMSDYCSGCPYDETETTGEGTCPFNALYWDFLDRNEDELRSNHRMGLVYGHLDDKDDAEMTAIRERAEKLRERATEGDL